MNLLNEKKRYTTHSEHVGLGLKPSWAVALFFALGLVLAVELGHGLPNRGVTWAPDGDPLVPLIFAKRVLLGGWNSGWHTAYPDFHRFVLLVFHAPYMLMQYISGSLDGLSMEDGYPYGIHSFDTIYTHLALITRAVSVLMALGMVYFVIRIGRCLFPDRPALFGGILAGLAPATVYYVHTETLDVPMLFWLSASIYCYVRVLQTFHIKYYVWLAILAAVSTATKDYAYGAFVLMPLPMVWALARSGVIEGGLLRAVVDRRHWIALLVFAVSFAAAENVFWNPSGFVNHVKLAAGASDTQQTITTSLLPTDLGVMPRLAQLGRVMPFVLGWVGLPLCLAGIGLVAVRCPRSMGWLLWPLAGLYCFSVVPVLPADPSAPGASIERPFMPMGVILAVFGGQLLAACWSAEKANQVSRGLCLACLLLIAANGGAMLLTLRYDTRYLTEQWFSENISEQSRVESYGYRTTAARLHGRWDHLIVNHDESPAESDIQITQDAELLSGLRQRRPDLIVVADPFARTWSVGKRSQAQLAPAYCEFFRLLEEGELGYQRATHFDPLLGSLFGMPAYRRLVPGITIYRRQVETPSVDERAVEVSRKTGATS